MNLHNPRRTSPKKPKVILGLVAVLSLAVIIGTPNAVDSGYPFEAGVAQIIIATVVLWGLILRSAKEERR